MSHAIPSAEKGHREAKARRQKHASKLKIDEITTSSSVNPFFQLLTDLKEGQFLGRYLDLGTGLGIAAVV